MVPPPPSVPCHDPKYQSWFASLLKKEFDGKDLLLKDLVPHVLANGLPVTPLVLEGVLTARGLCPVLLGTLMDAVPEGALNKAPVGGIPPLHRAVRDNNLEGVLALLQRGADPNCEIVVDGGREIDGATPLHVLLTVRPSNAHEIATALLRHGACIGCVNAHRQNPMQFAEQCENPIPFGVPAWWEYQVPLAPLIEQLCAGL